MKNSVLLGFVSCFVLAFGGCAKDAVPPAPPPPDGGPSFQQITPDPHLVNRETGCWFDNNTMVYTGTTAETLCDMRSQGNDIACSDLCEASAFNVYDLCGSVSKCKALLWVGSENPLEDQRGCWKCVDACFDNLDRTPEAYNACRQTADTSPMIMMPPQF